MGRAVLIALALLAAVMVPLGLAGGMPSPVGRVVPLVMPPPDPEPWRAVREPTECPPHKFCCGEPIEFAILVDESAVWVGSSGGDYMIAARADESGARRAIAGFMRDQRVLILDGPRRVHIAAGERADYGDLLAAIDLAREGGFDDVRVTTPGKLPVRFPDRVYSD